MKTPDNPPAFPNDHDTDASHPRLGMTLRDYFAAHAPDMPQDDKPWGEWDVHFTPEDRFEKLVAWRYAYADAMLAARSTPPASGEKEKP